MEEQRFMPDWIYIHENELKILKQHETRVNELTDALQRLKVEFIGFQERSKKDKEQAKTFALEGFLKELLPVLDSLDSSIEPIKDKNIRFGMELAKKEFLKLLENNGVTPIPAEKNMKFDHALHEAIEIIEDKNSKPDSIVEIIKSGYKYNNRILRPTLVKVNKGSDHTTSEKH